LEQNKYIRRVNFNEDNLLLMPKMSLMPKMPNPFSVVATLKKRFGIFGINGINLEFHQFILFKHIGT
jgi:hypothetical protein